jgi:hypothetical protein
MPTDAERFQFIARFRLHVAFYADHVALLWQKRVEHWEASPPYHAVGSGKTLAEATDAAIERYNRKHGLTPSSVLSESGVVRLHVRGWVS